MSKITNIFYYILKYIYICIYDIIYGYQINGKIRFINNISSTYSNNYIKIDPIIYKNIKKKFIRLYEKNIRFTYIKYKNIKYRFVVILYDSSNLKKIKDILLKIPIYNNINIFGINYYMDSVYDIRYLSLNYRYFYKTDIQRAYSSLNLNILFKLLNNYLTIHDYNYIRQLLYGYYKLGNNILNLNMLYQGLNISPILFSIYLNNIINIYITTVSDNNIYTYSDDILLFSNDKKKLKYQVSEFNKIINSFDLKLNTEKSIYIDVKKNCLIFLNRIIISHYNHKEEILLEDQIKKNNVAKYLTFFNFEKYINTDTKKDMFLDELDIIRDSCNEYIKYILYIYKLYILKNKNNYIYSNFLIHKNIDINKFIKHIHDLYNANCCSYDTCYNNCNTHEDTNEFIFLRNHEIEKNFFIN